MRPYSLFLIGCLSFSPLALADDDEKPADVESDSAASLKYKTDKGLILELNNNVSFRLDGYAQIEGTNDQDTLDEQGSPVIPRRLKLSLRARTTDYVSMKLGVDFAPLIDLGGEANVAANDDDGEFLNDAYIQGNVNDQLFIRAGYFKTPFGRQRSSSSTELLLPNRSVATGKFTFDRGAGGLVGGQVNDQRFEYQAGVTADLVLTNFLNVDPAPVGVIRLVANPLGPLKGEEGTLKPVKKLNASFGLNAGIPFDADNDTGNPVVGLDAAFEVGRIFALGEFFLRSRLLEDEVAVGVVNVDQENGGKAIQAGGFFQAGALVVPQRVQVGARFGVVGADPDLSDGNGNGNFNDQGLRTESSFGVNGFIFERRLMIQGMFSHFTEQDDDPEKKEENKENIFTLQLQGAL